MRLTLLTMLLLTLFMGTVSAEEGVVYTRAGEQAVIELNVETAPDLLVNRKNPPDIKLRQPFTETLLTAKVSGEAWAEQPEIYFERLEPITWHLQVPEDTEAGSYPLTIEANFALCDHTSGVCFTEAREVAVTLHVAAAEADVKDTGEDRAAILFLDTLDF